MKPLRQVAADDEEDAMSGPRKYPDRNPAPRGSEGKPSYETPLVVDLGDVARASGAACNPGTAPSAAHCGPGTAAKNCGVGIAGG